MTWTAPETTPPKILHRRSNVFTKLLPSNDREIDSQTHVSDNSSVVACILCRGENLPSRCLAAKGGIHIQTHRLMGGMLMYAVKIGSDAMISIYQFRKDWFRHSEVNRGNSQGHRHSMENV
jgi:hypothetical protein